MLFRLTEFEDTPTSQLTIDEFMRVDLEQECDPPSFTAGQHKTKMQQLEQELTRKLDEVEGEISCYRDEIETELENSRPKLRGIYATYTKEIDPQDEEAVSSTSDPTELEGEDAELQAAAQHFTQDFLCQVIQEEEEEGRKPDGMPEPEQEGSESQRQPAPLTSILGKLPTATSLSLRETLSVTDDKETDEQSDSGELDLNGIDDQEIDKYILNDKEVQTKTALWMKQNEEYLKEQKEKEERITKEKEQGTYKEKPKKSNKKREPIQASTAGEAIEKMLEQKRISSKINYDVLRDLNSRGGSGNSSPSRPTSDPPAGRKRLNRRKKTSTKTNQGLAATASIMGKRLRPLISSTPKKKKATTQTENNVTVMTAPIEATQTSDAQAPPLDPQTSYPQALPLDPQTPDHQAPPLDPQAPPLDLQTSEPQAPPLDPQTLDPQALPLDPQTPDHLEPPSPGAALVEDGEEEELEEEEEQCVSALQLIGGNDYGCEAEEEEVF
ncbi:transcription factor IIIB 90 kDa subunit-like [Diretmus argenteus]